MEASALHAPALGRRPLSAPLLRLRSDEQLVALFRAGSEEAFATMHDRYRQRLFAYVRQMLSATTRADAEDVLQDVFVRAYGALRADDRDVNLRAWLYRVAHNRCIDHLRRPTPPPAEVFEVSRTPLLDPIETAQRRDDLQRLVDDVGRLPEQQRSALLMREINGLAYADIATALDVTVPAVKSLLVRARVGLVEAMEARDTDCALIRDDLAGSYDRGVKASGRARKHMRECAGCREYRSALRGVKRSFAALTPAAGLGPLALVAKALGLGGAGGGAGAGAGVIGGGASVVGGSAAACKVAAVVCTAVVATGGAAAEVHHLATAPPAAHHVARAAAVAAPAAAALDVSAPVSDRTILRRTDTTATLPAAKDDAKATTGDGKDGADKPAADETDAAAPTTTAPGDGTADPATGSATGGASAPASEDAAPAGTVKPPASATDAPPAGKPADPAPATPTGDGAAQGAAGAPATDPATAGGTPPPTTSGPPPEH
jgi:RNA polymerase sigma factor (sigma-70 family)